jgi:hypothetical protein
MLHGKKFTMTLTFDLENQGSGRRTEVAKIGKEPVSEKQNLIDKCYDELVSMAKDIGMTLILL